MDILPKTYKNKKFPRISKIKITGWYIRPKKIKKRKTKTCIVKLKKSKNKRTKKKIL